MFWCIWCVSLRHCYKVRFVFLGIVTFLFSFGYDISLHPFIKLNVMTLKNIRTLIFNSLSDLKSIAVRSVTK